MSADKMARTVLHTGLEKHIDKFLDPDANGLPAGSPEKPDWFIVDALLQRGFEMIDEDGDVYVCSTRQVVELVKPYLNAVPSDLRLLLEKQFGKGAHLAGNRAAALEALIDNLSAPIPMVLYCPNCGLQHIDRPGLREVAQAHDETFYEEWTNPPHKSHLCRPEDGGCGIVWRPCDRPTNGVANITTEGKDDTWPGPNDEVKAQPAIRSRS